MVVPRAMGVGSWNWDHEKVWRASRAMAAFFMRGEEVDFVMFYGRTAERDGTADGGKMPCLIWSWNKTHW